MKSKILACVDTALDPFWGWMFKNNWSCVFENWPEDEILVGFMLRYIKENLPEPYEVSVNAESGYTGYKILIDAANACLGENTYKELEIIIKRMNNEND